MKASSKALLSVSVLAISAPALAQVAPTSGPSSAPVPVASPPGGDAPAVNEIVVTGSRIRRPSDTQATPVSTLSSAAIEGRGVVNLVDALNAIPAVGASTLSPSGAPRNLSTAGLYTVDLRALGFQTNGARTLVLEDGKRYVSSYQGGSAVDISTIPTDLIDRVEVTTGGGSAVYGSDAIAGVVNFILKKNFQGVSVNTQAGISSRGDAQQTKVSVLGGGNFADGRGNATLYVDYDKTKPIYGRDRAISSDGVLVADPTRPDQAVFGPGSYSSSRTQQGVYSIGSSKLTVLPNGTVTTPLGSRDNFDPNSNTIVYVGQTRLLTNGRMHYDLTDDLTFSLDASYARNNSVQQFDPTFITTGNLNLGGGSASSLPITVPVNNPFIPAAMRAALPASQTTIALSRNFPEFGPRTITYHRELYRAVASLDGKLPFLGTSWAWNAYYEYGRTTLDQQFYNGIDTQRFVDGLNVVPNGSGGYQCASAVARAQGCIPVNLFSGQRLSAAEISYLKQSVSLDSFNEQQVAAATVTGNLIQLPGGPLGVAVGAEWRRERSNFDPDAALQNGTTSLFYELPTVGAFTVKEGYAELTAPILKDVPFAHVLEVEAAYRYADYSTSGGVSAWKVGGNWAPVADLRFRGTYSRDVRAPQINDLFAGAAAGLVVVTDPCTGGGVGAQRTYCLGQKGITASFNPGLTSVGQVTQGNSQLKPEIAHTLTLGAVLTPHFIRGLTLTGDYFHIRIGHAITTLSVQQNITQCANTNNPVYCSAVIRDPNTGVVVQNSVVPINAASERMSGVDVELDYRTSLRNFAQGHLGDMLYATITYTRLIGYNIQTFPGTPAIPFLGDPLFPQNKANASLSWTKGPVVVSLNERYIGKAYRVPGSDFAGNAVSPYWYTDLQIRFNVGKNYSFYVGGKNIFNKQPPFYPSPYTRTSTGTNTAASVYDLVGRYVYAGISLRM
jgi:outer membrane receptor protein involved in Fe transport